MTAEDGIATFPVVAFLIFFIFFLLMIVFVIRMKKKHVEQMSNIPLSDDPVETRNTKTP